MDIGSAVLSVLTGGATGLIGLALQGVLEIWKQKNELELQAQKDTHDEKMVELNLKVMDKEIEGKVRIAVTEADSKRDVADSEAFAASFQNEPKQFAAGIKPAQDGRLGRYGKTFGWLLMIGVDALRATVRPGLTIYLAWIATQMYEQARAALAVIDGQPAVYAVLANVYQDIVLTLLYLFTTCVTWWFGSRNRQQPPKIGAR